MPDPSAPSPDDPRDDHTPGEPYPTPAEVARDDDLVQRVADGAEPPTGDRVGDFMARWRAEVDAAAQRQDRYVDPATTRLPSHLYADPRFNPIAFLPVAAPEGRIEYAGHVDFTWPPKLAFTDDDGNTYERADPDEFDSYDDVDSRTITDDGAPG